MLTVATLFGEKAQSLKLERGEVTLTVKPADYLDAMQQLRDAPGCKFEQLIDLSGIDYLDYGREEWRTASSTATGFSRGVDRIRDNVSETRPARSGPGRTSRRWRSRTRP